MSNDEESVSDKQEKFYIDACRKIYSRHEGKPISTVNIKEMNEFRLSEFDMAYLNDQCKKICMDDEKILIENFMKNFGKDGYHLMIYLVLKGVSCDMLFDKTKYDLNQKAILYNILVKNSIKYRLEYSQYISTLICGGCKTTYYLVDNPNLCCSKCGTLVSDMELAVGRDAFIVREIPKSKWAFWTKKKKETIYIMFEIKGES